MKICLSTPIRDIELLNHDPMHTSSDLSRVSCLPGVLAMEALHRQVLPFLLRRMKEDVLQDLPPKIIQDYHCDLSPLQVRLLPLPDETPPTTCNHACYVHVHVLLHRIVSPGNTFIDQGPKCINLTC